jgi:hypothetical protein
MRPSPPGGVILLAVWLAILPPVPTAADDLGIDGSGNTVRVEGDRLTLDVADMSLRALLLEIAQQSGARIQMDGVPDETVSDAFTRLPLDEALRRLLGDRGFTLVYAQRSTAGGSGTGLHLKEVRVYGGEGTRLDTARRTPTKARSERPTAAGPEVAAADGASVASTRKTTATRKAARDAGDPGAAAVAESDPETGEDAQAPAGLPGGPVELQDLDPDYIANPDASPLANPVAAAVLANEPLDGQVEDGGWEDVEDDDNSDDEESLDQDGAYEDEPLD